MVRRVQLEENLGIFIIAIKSFIRYKQLLRKKNFFCFCKRLVVILLFALYLFNIRELHIPKRLKCFKFNCYIML